jgi:Phosphopantetheine attachment site.
MIHDIEANIIKLIKDILTDQVNIGQLNNEDSLERIGLNSISFIRLTIAIEKEYGFQFDDEKLNINLFENLKSLAKYVESKIISEVQENS